MTRQINQNYQLIIGSHVSLKANEYFLGSVKEALSYGANALMVYTGAPQNTKRIPITDLKISEGVALLNQNQIDLKNVIIHAPYIINLCSSKSDIRELAKNFLIQEIKRTAAIGAKYIVLHPGSCLDQPVEIGLKEVVDGLNYVLKQTQSDVVICLETMAGKGSEVNVNLDQLAILIQGIEDQSRIGVCLDTCHINDEGYPIAEFDKYLNEFDQKIGINKIKVVHLNDSKNLLGSHKDRHENLGYGHIGFDALLNVAYHPLLNGIPKILETPYFSFSIEGIKKNSKNSALKPEVIDFSIPLYQEEIAMIRNKEWYDVKTKIINDYQKNQNL